MRAGQSQTPECRGVRAKLVGCRWIGDRSYGLPVPRRTQPGYDLSGGRNFSMLCYCWLAGWVPGLGLDHIHRPRGTQGRKSDPPKRGSSLGSVVTEIALLSVSPVAYRRPMTACRPIRLNAFDMACVGHIQHGMWTHPRDRSSDYTSLEHWVRLAQMLERGLFDGLFLADVLGVYDVYRGTADASLSGGVQIPLLDPMALVPAMAYATTHLGFGVTCDLAYEPPFLFARRMATLDHLTRGRIGWNIVTGYLDSAARAMGFAAQIEHDDRYDLADEYLQVVYALWEGGWADDAVLRDRECSIYTDPRRVRRVRHRGKQFDIDAIPLW